MNRARIQQGAVVFDRRSKTWHFLWRKDGHRHSKLIGRLREYPTKAAAWRAAEPFRRLLEQPTIQSAAPTVKEVVERYIAERFPRRLSTGRAYRAWLNNHILPYWGAKAVTELQPRPVELWLRQLDLSPKSKVHVKTLLRILVDFAMWSGVMDVSRNPLELVVIRGATKRTRQPRSLTVEEFGRLIERLEEPLRTMACVAACFGLRASELLALKWKDVDWLNGKLRIERAIVRQTVDDVKTASSARNMAIAPDVLHMLMSWKQQTQFAGEEDWIFASPLQLGRLPWSYPWLWRELHGAAIKAGIGPIGAHTLRHTYRSWLDAVGTAIAVQQKLMRHTDIRTTLNLYGDVVTDEMAEAQSKVARLALHRV